MKVTFNLSDEFRRQFKRLAKKYPSLVNDYDTFKKELCKNPFQGADLGGGGLEEVDSVSVPVP